MRKTLEASIVLIVQMENKQMALQSHALIPMYVVICVNLDN